MNDHKCLKVYLWSLLVFISMFKIMICGPMVSGKSMLANALVDCSTDMQYRFSSELALANKMVFGASDGFRVHPTREAAERGLEVMTIEKNSQLDFFRNIRTGILGYTDKDIAFVQTEHPCKLLNTGVEIVDLPYPTTDNLTVIHDFLLEADLVICCINYEHGMSSHTYDYFKSMLEYIKVPVLFVITHFDYYRMDKELRTDSSYYLQDKLSSLLRPFYSKLNESQLYLLDSHLYIEGLGTNNLKMIDRSRFLYLKTEIYRQVAMAYYDRVISSHI